MDFCHFLAFMKRAFYYFFKKKIIDPKNFQGIPGKNAYCVGAVECDNFSEVYDHLAQKSRARTRANEYLCVSKDLWPFRSNSEWNKNKNSSNISKSYFLRRKTEASINNDGRGSLRLVKLPNSFSTLIVSFACLKQFADRDEPSRFLIDFAGIACLPSSRWDARHPTRKNLLEISASSRFVYRIYF